VNTPLKAWGNLVPEGMRLILRNLSQLPEQFPRCYTTLEDVGTPAEASKALRRARR
jgi:hypothetical protein